MVSYLLVVMHGISILIFGGPYLVNTDTLFDCQKY
jgi:hypothetical protein